ncbi:MAG: hypothetical protein ACO3QM_05105 [Candidatus Nanopelagicaceae bacterium]
MTRIVGRLDGADGPLEGRLFVKAGGAFIGAPAKDLVFKVQDGIVDIELPPCPAGLPYAVDWRAIGDTRRLSYVERWRVPPVEEISLDEARGLVRSNGRKLAGSGKGDLIEATMLRNENNELRRQIAKIEEENASLLRQVSQAEGKAAAAQAKAATISADLIKLQRDTQPIRVPLVVEPERIIEKRVLDDEQREQVALYEQQIALLEIENKKLQEEMNETISLSTHFANLHAEIGRLSNEKQQLLLRIAELQSPVRSTSSLRNEAIANLDKLISG